MYDRYELLLQESGMKSYHVCQKLGIPPSTITGWRYRYREKAKNH